MTEANQRESNLVVSRRELLEQERAEQREKTWAELEEGQVRHGVVRSVKHFGAFVDIGGVDGLLPVGEMSWSRVADAADFIKVGQEVDVKVLKIDRQTSKVSFGLKQLTPSPWDLVEDKYRRGMIVKGRVTRLMDFGAFVELEPGIEGLIHISELSPNRVRRVADIVKPEQEVEVRILKIEPEAKKISLSLRPLPTARRRRLPRKSRPRRLRTRRPRLPSPSARFRSREVWATANHGREARSKERRRLGMSEHQVEVLHGDAGRSLDQVVEAGEDQDLAADDPHGDVAEVGEGRILGRRQVVDDPDERDCRRRTTR